MMTRRSLAVMSAVDGSLFAVYQGAFLRRASASAGWWPAVAYQQTARAWQASMNGMVRSTAAAAPRPRLLPSAALRVAGRSPPGRITIPLAVRAEHQQHLRGTRHRRGH